MPEWRTAGLTYMHYSNICARLMRKAYKPEFLQAAQLRDRTNMQITIWEDGKPARKDPTNPEKN